METFGRALLERKWRPSVGRFGGVGRPLLLRSCRIATHCHHGGYGAAARLQLRYIRRSSWGAGHATGIRQGSFAAVAVGGSGVAVVALYQWAVCFGGHF